MRTAERIVIPSRLRVAVVSWVSPMTAMWHERAKRLLEQAVAEMDDIDCIPTVTAALAALRIEVGELPADEMDGYNFPGEDNGPECTCPADLAARGGWSGQCPAHGSWLK